MGGVAGGLEMTHVNFHLQCTPHGSGKVFSARRVSQPEKRVTARSLGQQAAGPLLPAMMPQHCLRGRDTSQLLGTPHSPSPLEVPS